MDTEVLSLLLLLTGWETPW